MKLCNVCIDSEIQLDGTVLSGDLLKQFNLLSKQSFIVKTARCGTLPPSPKSSLSSVNDSEGNSAWKITSEDLTQLVQPMQPVTDMGNFFHFVCIFFLSSVIQAACDGFLMTSFATFLIIACHSTLMLATLEVASASE
ncbi:hypothetical protein J3R82DRAFT_445 [Butyriboletus roseoflavus]|nr:hypothetical protein J3R82DRAFT_445 [Butyriboletus roseoflavus]